MVSVWIAIVTITGLALIAGIALGYAARRLPAGESGLVDEIDRLLPQTQCGQCGYPGCRPYAEAIVNDAAPVNLCPPGGVATVRRLAARLGRDAPPLAGPVRPEPVVARIDESLCIGCMHCRNACPVDAIIGAHQFMHTVIETECTGCELCLAPCPVDCISLRPLA